MNKATKTLLSTAVAGIVAAGVMVSKTTPAFADHNPDHKTENGKNSCKGGSCKGGSCEGKKNKSKKPKHVEAEKKADPEPAKE